MDAPSADGAPLAEGDISGLADGTPVLRLARVRATVGPGLQAVPGLSHLSCYPTLHWHVMY